jgi:riboflavin kinase/FMN adenylyltransferase
VRVFRHISDVPEALKGAVIAIGNFDGVHRGHRALLAEAAHLADTRYAPFAVLVFEPCPQEFFRPGGEPFRLTPFRAKARALAELGADALFALAFDAEMAHRSAQDFILDILVGGLEAGCVVVGADFRFGKGRAGDAVLLSYMGEMEGFGTSIVTPVAADGEEKISSTAIRQALKTGKPEDAARLLGRPFAIEGRVEHGEKRGTALGYPTANMHLGAYIRPAFGVYAARATVFENDQAVASHDGVANLGIRPMFESAEPLLETHLFDFSGDLYGKHLAVELIGYLRPEEKFDGINTLKAQMARDAESARGVLSCSP